jgi:hypothetical protein
MDREENSFRELLEAFFLTGVRVVVFLPTFHVEGRITKIHGDFVTLRRGNGEGVEVESNDNGGDLENPNQITVRISAILSVSDDRGA